MKKELENFLEGRDIRDSEDMNKALGEFTLKCLKDFANINVNIKTEKYVKVKS